MFERLKKALFSKQQAVAPPLVSLPREQVAHLLVLDEGMPHVDWGMAAAWIAQRTPDPAEREGVRRAVAAAWLDELRDVLTTDSRRWRRGIVEGLAPLEGTAAVRLANCSDASLTEIARSLMRIRGNGPIDPIAVVALRTHDEYYSFVSHFYSQEGSFATSGGLYIRGDGDSFPLLVINAHTKQALENVVAHELTHHALRDCRLPLWAEEGLTQMMEERVTGGTHFKLDREMLERHRSLWLEDGFERLLDGSGFHSPDGQTQELSYHLAQMLVRSLLSTQPRDFFAFARACTATASELAAREHLGAPIEVIAEKLLG